MNIVFYNFVPDQISSEYIDQILHRLMDLLPIKNVSIINGKDSIDFLKEVLDLCSLRNEKLVKEVVVHLATYSAGGVKESSPFYKIFKLGYKNGIVLKDSKFVVVSGDLYRLTFPYGDAYENVCMINKPEEKVIWHETAHLFNVQDHYDIVSKKTICGDDKCFMQWEPLDGSHFCKKALGEVENV